MEEHHINAIIDIFHKVKIWNDGKFVEGVTEYCNNNNIDVNMVNSKLEIAFKDYLATNIKSEAAIRLRLSQLMPKKVAL